MVSEVMLAITAILLVGTISALLLYYKRIAGLRQEYYSAKNVVNDIVLSVDGQLRRQKDRFLFVVHKMENVLLENKKVEEKVEEFEKKITNVTKAICETPQIEEKLSLQIEEMRSKVEGIKVAQDNVMKKLIEIEKIKREPYIPETKIEAAIPIKKEKALEPLTETELIVLETISKEGEKTAPEIREKIGLTREHSARLMKKLYKDGYLERDTHKMPYIYRLKDEMQKILKKREANTS
jgi:DNA-binding MarR family transcriptional regulator